MVRAYSDYKGANTRPAPSGPTGRWGLPMYFNSTGQAPSGTQNKPFDADPNKWVSHRDTGQDGTPAGGQAAPGNQVRLHQPGNPYQFTPQQTNAAANYQTAQAFANADPRWAAKKYQRGGMSSSKGTAAAGSADAAAAYSAGMASAEQARMQDAYANANTQLASDASRNQFGQALAGLQDQAAQMQYMNNMRNAQRATDFMGNVFGTFTQPMGGGGNNNMLGTLLSGLL